MEMPIRPNHGSSEDWEHMDDQGETPSDILRRLEALVTHPREELGIEIKGWLDLDNKVEQADMAKALLALANSGGGFVLCGFTEVDNEYVPTTPRPSDLSKYSQDAINGIVQSYAHPPFHCQVYHVRHPDTGLTYPVVRVPGGHRTPIRSQRDGPEQKHVRMNTYYIRRPGPKSEAPQTAQEWDDLIARCIRAAREELLDSIRHILTGYGGQEPSGTPSPANPETMTDNQLTSWIEQCLERFEALCREELVGEEPSRYAHGTWLVAYSVSGQFERPDLSRFMQIVREVQGHETGWPPWWVPNREDWRPHPYNGVIECWMREDHDKTHEGASSDFWRASPQTADVPVAWLPGR